MQCLNPDLGPKYSVLVYSCARVLVCSSTYLKYLCLILVQDMDHVLIRIRVLVLVLILVLMIKVLIFYEYFTSPSEYFVNAEKTYYLELI